MAAPALSILIVDDIPSNIKLLKIILQDTRIQLFDAYGGEEALVLARKHKPFLILLDIMMPGMNGFEVCRRIKADPEISSSIVVFISAKNTPEDKAQGLAMGAADFITKPFHKDEILLRIQSQISFHSRRKCIEESEQRYSVLADAIQEAVFIWHPLKGLVSSNQRFADILCCPSDRLAGLQLRDFVSKDALQQTEKAFNELSIDAAAGAAMEISLPIQTDDSKGPTLSMRLFKTELMQESAVMAVANLS